MQVQIVDRMRIDVTMPADALDPLTNVGLRLLTTQKQRRPSFNNVPQPVT
jgi:hypothetical protein